MGGYRTVFGVSKLLNVALQFGYQVMKLGDIINGRIISLNLHTSTDLIPVISPYIGVGFEDTRFFLAYRFVETGEDIRIFC